MAASSSYQPRVIDRELDELMPGLAAISIEGAKGVGKTVTGRQRAQRIFALEDDTDRSLLASDITLIDNGAYPVLIDEWQRFPTVWDTIRRRVDDGATPGSYLLTGSAVPQGVSLHSGAGRIVSLRMRPMSLHERGLDTAAVSLADLVSGVRPTIRAQTEISMRHYVDEIVASGFPGIRASAPRVRRAQLDGYLERIVAREFPEQGLAVRRPATLRSWLKAYAAATATTASYNAILDAATGGETNKPAKSTTIAYRDVLDQLYLLDPVPGWWPSGNELTRAAQAPKHHLADPALAARLLGLDAAGLLVPTKGGRLVGALFESLVTLGVKSYAQAAEARVLHFRARNGGHEVDLIVERADSRVVAIEVKLAASVGDDDVKHLVWLKNKLGDTLLDAIVITTGPYAYRRQDGIGVVPAALLGP